MRNLWAALKFIGRWLGPALVLLAAWLFLFPLGLLLDVWKLTALAGGLISALAWFAGRKSERVIGIRCVAAAAIIGLAMFAYGYWHGKRGYHTETVTFDNRGARLVGTLYLPDRPGKHPGIVWVHGGGPGTRMQFSPIAIHFAQAGYATVIFDKRGISDSTGHYEPATIKPDNLDLLASDASAALTLLAKRPEVRADMVGIVGASAGGWVTPKAAVLNGHAAFMLLLSGATYSTHSHIRYEAFHLFGGKNPDSPLSQTSLSTGLKSFVRGDVPDGMSIDQAADEAQNLRIDVGFANYDPMGDLRKLNIPGLWLVGDKDWTIPSGPTRRNITLLRKEGKPYAYRDIPGGWHVFAIGPKQLVLDTMDNWLARVTVEERKAASGAPRPSRE
ncbi:MAG: prolyl oligopeptidase family serine peptidase [Novosphingobium sp.]